MSIPETNGRVNRVFAYFSRCVNLLNTTTIRLANGNAVFKKSASRIVLESKILPRYFCCILFCLTSACICGSFSLSTHYSIRTMPVRVIPWPKARPPPLDRDGLRKCMIAMRWRPLVMTFLWRHYNNVMTNALAHIVHARARAAVVVQHQLALAITDLPFAEEAYRHIPCAICNYLGWPAHEVMWRTCRSVRRWAYIS